MREVRDSFLHYLADNLVGVPVHNLRYEENNPKQSHFRMNALNVEFITFDVDFAATTTVTLDLVYENELAAEDAKKLVVLLLRANFIPMLDYSTTPATDTKSKITWDTRVRFMTVVADDYYHLTANVVLNHLFYPQS